MTKDKKLLCMISGGIDSPVSAYLMIKNNYSVDYILEDQNSHLRDKQQILDLFLDNGYFIYEVQLWDKKEIIKNFNSPIFRIALYPNIMKFLWCESILLVFVSLFSANLVIVNLIKRNIDSLSLLSIRGLNKKKFHYFFARIFLSINIISFFSIILGLLNSLLTFEILGKSQFMKGFHNQEDRISISWFFLPLSLLLTSCMIFILYKITSSQFNRLIRNSNLLITNLKVE